MKVRLDWEDIGHDGSGYLYRAKVFGGWLVRFVDERTVAPRSSDIGREYEPSTSIAFVPDPDHQWGKP